MTVEWLPAETWIEDSFEDFRDGRLDASGQNIYAAIDGSVRTIHRYDLNGDGHIDLLFNNSHDYYYHIPATMGWIGKDGRVTHGKLAVEGSCSAAVGDLNRDGFMDIVFCPNKNEIHPRRLLTVIYGTEDGWQRERTGGFLTGFYADKVLLADLNADQWPDIIVLNSVAWEAGQPQGRIVRVYWGAEEGFMQSQRMDLGIEAAVDMAAGDLDGDGADDLAVLSGNGRARVFLSSAFDKIRGSVAPKQVSFPCDMALCISIEDANNDRRSDLIVGSDAAVFLMAGGHGGAFATVKKIGSDGASHISAGDLDGDGRCDLVLAFSTTATAVGGQILGSGKLSKNFLRIIWGGDQGFQDKNTKKISIRFPRMTAVADMNGDGRQDIVVAVRHGEEVFATNSIILLGRGGREFKRADGDLPTDGPEHVVVAPAHGKLPPRAVFCNRVGGTLGEMVSPVIYWGSTGGFSTENTQLIPRVSAYESSAADLDLDGHVDLVMPLFGHSKAISQANRFLGGTIFWGAKAGFDFAKRNTVLRDEFLITSNVADLNRDGYLDLVFGQSRADSKLDCEQLIIHYGGKNGITGDSRVAIPSPGRSVSSVVADFNQDQWLDICVNSRMADKIRIFWGSKEGFATQRQATLSIYNPVDVDTADLNGDGHLDLIVSTLEGRLLHLDRMGTMILWGGKKGFSTDNVQRLPSFMALGQCVADLDGDGFLDIVTPNYTGGNTRETNPSHIFWGSAEGFSPWRKTRLFCRSCAAALAADFDCDGKLDLAMVTHRDGASHRSYSQVFYNDGRRFQDAKVTRLPTSGPHWLWHGDMGHIADRRWRQSYQSSVYSLQKPHSQGSLSATATVPQGSRLVFAIRSTTDKTRLEGEHWRTVHDGSFTLRDDDRYIQYRALFISDNGDRYPILKRIQIELK